LAGAYKNDKYNSFVLTSSSEPIQNLYFRLFNIERVCIEDLDIEAEKLDEALVNTINSLEDFESIKRFEEGDSPVGKMALSTFSRMQATGIMDIDDSESRAQIRNWMLYLCRAKLTPMRSHYAGDNKKSRVLRGIMSGL